MTLFIEGLAFPLNQKNANGWGIPASEADNAIKTLQSSVIRICPRDGPHDCDFSEDPKSEVGRIVAAWREGDVIRARGQITDSVAAQKIADGTWEKNWSTYVQASNIDSDGWATGIEARSMTLVRNPAWSQAAWEIAAADGGYSRFRTLSQFTLIASSQEEGETITEELEKLKVELEEKDKIIEELKPVAASVPELEAKVGELTASIEDLKGKLEEKNTLVASLEKGQAGSVPMDQVKVLIASAIEEHDKETAEKAILSASRERFVNARKELGLETKDTEFTSLSASDFDAMTEMLSVKLSASGQPPRYPASQDVNVGMTGAYNPKTGVWE